MGVSATIRFAAVGVTAATAVALAAPTVTAAAVERSMSPIATLQAVHSKINARTAPKFSYAVMHAKTTKVLLQRQFGTQGVWKTVASVRHRQSGTITAPSLPQLGKYEYRIEGLLHRRVVVRSKDRAVYAYGSVSLLAFCRTMHKHSDIFGATSCGTHTQQTGTTIFTYAMTTHSAIYPHYMKSAWMKATSCRSMTVQYTTESYAKGTAYLELIQGASDAQYAQNGPNSLGKATFKFDGGVLYFKTAGDGAHHAYDSESWYIHLAGTASCYTLSGKP